MSQVFPRADQSMISLIFSVAGIH